MKRGVSWVCMRVRPVFLGSAAVFLGGAILLRGEEAAEGVRQGIALCLTSVIPSLFLFLAFADFLALTDVGDILFRPLGFLGAVFGVPEEAAPVILLSLIGGYPVGGKMLARMVRQGRLEPRTAERLLCFCVNCSPAFLIAGVAVPCFGSVKIGGVLYGCQAAAAVAVGLLARGFWGRGEVFPENPPRKEPKLGLLPGFVAAVTEAGKSMFVICSFVLVFSVISHAAALLPGGKTWVGLLEVTVGCAGLPGRPGLEKLVLAVVYTAFGGLCVWMQTACFLRGTGVRMRKFVFLRGVYVLVSLGLTLFFVRKLRLPLPAFATAGNPVAREGAATLGASALLVVLCLMLLISRKKCDRIGAGPRTTEEGFREKHPVRPAHRSGL